ncbi:hypothetical protein WA026_011305 [Henosepilachna vigintioctopunctata]|uniref:Reverse transcriptase domain-containing protein n=1 Tax=Henosepilachna vigintioctopunctata TaxID=420089 RepID=A0AAW1U693_9CUCU
MWKEQEFLWRLSIRDGIQELIEKLPRNLNLCKRTAAVFLDWPKTFNIVPRDWFIDTLRYHGIRGEHIRTISLEIPQEPVLVPILFLIYLKFPPKTIVNGIIVLYVYDTVFTSLGKTWEEVEEKADRTVESCTMSSEFYYADIKVSNFVGQIYQMRKSYLETQK